MLAVMLAMTGTQSVFAQNTGQRQRQMEQQMAQMQQTMQRMDRVMLRTQEMSQNMNQYMERAQGEQLRNQIRMTRRMSEELGIVAGTLKGAAERCQLMAQDQEMIRDREMAGDMTRLREQMHQMSSQVENAVQTMERVTNRLRLQIDGGTN